MIKLFPENIVNAICDALLLSFALGIMLALITGIIVLSTRKATARLRYNLLVSSLIVFAILILTSFIGQLLSVQPAIIFENNNGAAIPFTASASTDLLTGNSITGMTNFFRTHADTIVLLWLLIVTVKALQMITGLQSIMILKTKKTNTLTEQWQTRVVLLAKQLGIRRLVRIVESGIAKTPMVIGHLKPVILLPVGLITSLPPESVEAILVHELAHIRRSDWLVNLMVNALETIFFFNPAVLWIASLIRAERENCCDDIAIAHTGSMASYIDTLVTCQEYNSSAPQHALAFSGKKRQLLTRVKRMISNRNTSLNRTEQGFMAATLFIAFIGIIAFTTADKNTTGKEPLHFVIKPDSMYTDQLASVQFAGDSLITISDSMHLYTDSIKHMITQSDRANKYCKDESLVNPGGIGETNPFLKTIPSPDQFLIYKPAEVSDRTDVTMPNGDALTRLVKLEGILYQINSVGGKVSSLQVNGNNVGLGQLNRYLEEIDRHGADISSPESYKHYEGYQNKYQPYTEDPDETELKKLVVALIAAGVIERKEQLLSFKLSDTEFIMNGRKMPDDIYQPLRTAFVKVPADGKKGSWSWMFNYNAQNNI
jgi:beta-lactamase regulating signal transducer with metallopeptidase domain